MYIIKTSVYIYADKRNFLAEIRYISAACSRSQCGKDPAIHLIAMYI